MDNVMESAHPSVERLRTFGLGQLDEVEAVVIEEHVSHCDACCRTLADVRSDTFIDVLRSSSQAAPGVQASEAPTMAPGRPLPLADGGQTSADSASVGLPPELSAHPRYRVLALLGAGGMGAVYKAEHRLMERVVALKVMTRVLVGSAATVDRFRREVKAAARLAHPNIVAAYDAEQAGDVHFLVMEYVEGTDLARWVAEHGPLPAAEACDYVRQAALGLQHAHEHSMIHRDIKPHNLMRTPDGTVKVLDFGLARLAAEGGAAPSGVTGQGILLGTVDYLAPEQADDARQADIRSDIYSLGCTLYHLLSGRPPFPKGTVVQKIMAHTERDPLPVKELRPDLPPGLNRVVKRMMAKSPEDRYQTPDEVWAALAPFVGQTVVLDPAPARKKRVARPKESGGSRRRWPVVVATLLLALVGVVAGAAVYRIQTDNGELVITTDNPDVEVVIKQNGKLVRIIDTKTNKEVKLESGLYELELKGNPEELKLSLDKVTIRRSETVVATITRNKKTPLVAKPALLYSISWQDEQQGFPAHIYQTGISSDGRLFFGAGDAGPTGRIRVFDLATGKQVQELVPDGDLWASFAQLLPSGKYLVAGYTGDKDLYLWDIATGKVVRKFAGHTENGSRFAVSPDGKRILSWNDDKTVRLWDVETGKELRKLEGHTDKAAGVFSPDGKQVLTFSPDKTLRLWDVESGKELRKLEGHTDSCTGCFSLDGKQALSYGPDGTIRLWDLGTGKEVRWFEGPTDKVAFACFVAGGRLVVGKSEDQKFRVWDAASGKLVSEIDYSKYGQDGGTITASPDGRHALVSVDDDSSVRVLDLRSGQETCRYDRCPKARVFSFSPDGTLAVAGSFRAGMYVFRLPAPPPPLSDKVGAVRGFHWESAFVPGAAFSPNGVWAVSGDKEGIVRLWDLRTGKEVRRLPAHTGTVYGVAFSPDGSKVVSAGTIDKLLRLSDVATGKELRRFEGHEREPVRIAFSADGRQFLSGDWGGSLRLWDVESGKELQNLQGHTDMIHAVAFAPDGKTAASGSRDNTIRLWDLKTGKEERRIDANAECVSGIAFAPDGKQMLSSHFDGTMRWWDVVTGKEVRRFAVQTDTIQSMALSPDGRFALTGGGADITNQGWKKGTDFTVRLWDVVAGKEVQRFEGHQDVITWVTLSRDGRYALSCSHDGSMRLWRLPDPPAR